MSVCMLTTVDNPYNPYTDFDEWFNYDCSNQYYSCGLLSRTLDLFTDSLNASDEEIEEAINIILKNDFRGIYLKLNNKDSFKKPKVLKENDNKTEN